MKKVDGYISELLYTHDCVILPEFGGFVTNYAPALLNPSKHTLYPPSKDILFNAQLRKNDGLLANYIAEQEHIPYSESMLHLQGFTAQCMSSLNARETVAFENIGTFTINREEKIEFTPFHEINYLEDAYGLTSLVSPPLHGKQRIIRQTPVTVRKITGRSPRTGSAIARLAFATVLLAVTTLWGYYHSPLLKDIYTHYSGIIPLIRSVHLPVPVLTENGAGTLVTKEAVIPSPTPVPVTVEPKKEPAAEIKPAESQPTAEPAVNYYIIAGAFQDPDNAASLIERLRSKGFDARMAGRTKGGLFRVSYGHYPDNKQAIQHLEKIKLSENPDAWMFVE